MTQSTLPSYLPTNKKNKKKKAYKCVVKKLCIKTRTSKRISREKKLIMAFQIPLMRSDYDIYKMNHAKSRPIAAGKQSSGRSHKVSESHSYSTSPGQNDPFIGSPSHRNLHHVHSAGGRFNNISRVNSRTSQSSLIMSPTKSQSMNNPSPPKPAKSGSQSSLHKFSLVDRIKKVFKSGSSEESSRS